MCLRALILCVAIATSRAVDFRKYVQIPPAKDALMSYMYDKFVLAVHGNVTETLVRQPEGERAVATCARKCLKQEDCVAFDLIATSAGQPSCRLHNVEKLDTDDWPDNVVRQGQCGDKWYQHDGYCYFLSSNRLTWKNASNACVNVDANLVSIRNADENSFLSAFLMVQGKNADLIWIGGFSKDYVHRKWADESPWTFETFGAGEPDEADSCYAVYRFMWYDVSCGENAYPFVCKRRV